MSCKHLHVLSWYICVTHVLHIHLLFSNNLTFKKLIIYYDINFLFIIMDCISLPNILSFASCSTIVKPVKWFNWLMHGVLVMLK